MTASWTTTQDLANALLLNPLKGMEHIADLLSQLTALTKQGLNDQDHKYNCLKSATDITGNLLDDLTERFAELDGPKLAFLRAKLAEHETQLNDLFGAAPNKLTRRVDTLDDKITAALAGTNAIEQRHEKLEAYIHRAHARIDDLESERLDKLETRLENHASDHSALYNRVSELEKARPPGT